MIADIQVLPTPSGTAGNEHEHVEAAIAAIASSGCAHSVHALGTTVDVWKGRLTRCGVVCGLHSRPACCFKSGANKELMMLKLYQGTKTVTQLESSGQACAARNASAPLSQVKSHRWIPQAFTGAARTQSGRKRVCFTLQFEPSRLEGYLKDHESVWPEMQRALVECGWHNYSLFYRPDGMAIGYFETDESLGVACRRMDSHPVNAKWQTAMAKYTPQGTSPIDGVSEFEHYFYLGDDVEGVHSNWDSEGGAQLATAGRTVVALVVGLCAGLALGVRLRK